MIQKGEVKEAIVEIEEETGSPFSRAFDDIYASRDGAYLQAQHVFLKGNGLPERWKGKESFTVLENGFGLGVNFLTTWKCWKEDLYSSQRLNYVSIERYPVSKENILRFAPAELKSFAGELASAWPLIHPGVHQVILEKGKLVLTLYFMDALEASKKMASYFDALYLDGFSPKKNPQMWEPKLIKNFCKSAYLGATCATWSVSGQLRKTLLESGFNVSKVSGFGHKSQMTIGEFCPKFKHPRFKELVHPESSKVQSVTVIGAGVAGTAVVAAFARRGIKTTVIDAGPVAASQASAIRWAIMHVQPSSDDNPLFRLTRAGLFCLLENLKGYEHFRGPVGLFQMAKDEAEWKKWAGWIRENKPFDFGRNFLSLIDEREVSKRIGVKPARGGLWHAQGGLVALAQWVRQRIEDSGAQIIFNTEVAKLKRGDGGWNVVGKDDRLLAHSDIVVVCCAQETEKIIGQNLQLDGWKGRFSILCEDSLTKLNGAMTGPGYCIHSPDDWIGVGATYEKEAEPLTIIEAHKRNLTHVKEMLPLEKHAIAAGFYEGIRCVSKDRLPIVGKVDEGLFVSCAMGSRGLVLSDLYARIITALVFNEPSPVEADLVRLVSPERFLKA